MKYTLHRGITGWTWHVVQQVEHNAKQTCDVGNITMHFVEVYHDYKLLQYCAIYNEVF